MYLILNEKFRMKSYYIPGMGGVAGGMGGAAGADGVPGMGGGATGATGAKSACSSGTCPAGVHAAMPCCHTIVWAVSCFVGTNCFRVL